MEQYSGEGREGAPGMARGKASAPVSLGGRQDKRRDGMQSGRVTRGVHRAFVRY